MEDSIDLDKNDVEAGGIESAPPPPAPPAQLEKREVVRTPEEQERLSRETYGLALRKQGGFKEEDREVNEEIARSVTEKSIAAADAAGIEVPVDFMSDLSALTAAISQREGATIDITDDTLEIIKSVDASNVEEIYQRLADMSRMFTERGKVPPPSREEAEEVYALIEKVISEKSNGDPAGELLKFNYYLKEFADVRWSTVKEKEGKIQTEEMTEALEEIIGTIVEGGALTINAEDALRILKDSGIKVPKSWKAAGPDKKMAITLAMQTAAKTYESDAMFIETSEGPMITVGGKEE